MMLIIYSFYKNINLCQNYFLKIIFSTFKYHLKYNLIVIKLIYKKIYNSLNPAKCSSVEDRDFRAGQISLFILEAIYYGISVLTAYWIMKDVPYFFKIFNFSQNEPYHNYEIVRFFLGNSDGSYG